MKPCTKALYVSLISRCDSAAIVPNTRELLPEPETPVNTVSCRFGSSTLTSFRLFTRAPCTRIRSWLPATRSTGDFVWVLGVMACSVFRGWRSEGGTRSLVRILRNPRFRIQDDGSLRLLSHSPQGLPQAPRLREALTTWFGSPDATRCRPDRTPNADRAAGYATVLQVPVALSYCRRPVRPQTW